MTPREPDRFADLLRAARDWIDKHKCCTEERQALIAEIDEALDEWAHLRAPVVSAIPSADAQATRTLMVVIRECAELRCAHIGASDCVRDIALAAGVKP